MYYGAGAGMLPTAMAVVSDMIEVGRNMFARAAGARRPRPRPMTPRKLVPADDVHGKYYLRFGGVRDQPGVLGQLMTILGAHGVSIAQVVQEATDGKVSVVALTHESREGHVRIALEQITRLQIVGEPPRLIRIAA